MRPADGVLVVIGRVPVAYVRAPAATAKDQVRADNALPRVDFPVPSASVMAHVQPIRL
jgi:hypothetical protein